MKLILIAGGIYHLCWALFDSCWPHFFAWKRTLAKLDDINRSLLYIVSRLLVLLYLYIATLEFFFRDELLNSTIGKSVLIFMTVYWGFRTIMQIQFFGFARAERMNIKFSDLNYPAPANRLSTRAASTIFFVIMLMGFALCLAPSVI
jgi:hypothetical protein